MPDTREDPSHTHTGARVVLLAGPGQSTDIVANFLAARVPDLMVVVEDLPSRWQMARRRAARLGWRVAAGQVLFVTLLLPLLRRQAAGRRVAILHAAAVDTSPRKADYRVRSVNDAAVVTLLESLRPALMIVNGTRIITRRVLDAAGCPVVNMHAGITPRYRGVHGGYWALAEGHPEWVGTTVHLVDSGIDTGGILAQTVFEVTGEDSFATYPSLHVVHGLALLGAQVDKVLAGSALDATLESIAPGTGLYYHPTVWGYLGCRRRQGVR
jgi:folate-dependent phosphoribosylglycinamide formyltransferase PurN